MSADSLAPKSRRPTGQQNATRSGVRKLPASGDAPALPQTHRPLPHERDQATDPAAVEPDPVIEQAKRDIDAGLVDTDMRATPGLSAARRRKLVPGPGGRPPESKR